MDQSSKNSQEKKRTSEMTNCMDDLSLSSPKDRVSCSCSKVSSKRSYARSSSGSSVTSRSSSSSSSRSSRSRSWSRSSSRSRYQRSKRYRRDSRSPCRSRSRSYTPPHRRYPTSYRRYYRSPPRYRSRSRSRSYSRFHYRRSYSRSRSRSRGRRYYGSVHRPYSSVYGSYRSRSRTRSRSCSPFFLSDKDKRKLLEIAKANAAKAFGKEIELPASLRTDPWAKERKNEEVALKQSELSRQTEDCVAEKCSSQKNILFSSNNTVAKPVLQKQTSNDKAASSRIDDVNRRSPYGQWLPISVQKSFSSSLSPKRAQTSRSR